MMKAFLPLLVLLAGCQSQALGHDPIPADFRDAKVLIPDLVVDLRYLGADNFLGRPVPGYEANRCYLQQRAAEALARVQQALASEGLGLKVFDCYRPQRSVDAFVAWSRDLSDQTTKARYYPDIDKRALLGPYIAERSGHSRGSTVDLTLVQGGRELEMGTAFDFFGPASHPDRADFPAEVRANRARLARAMQAEGFVPLPEEWWHFRLRDEAWPDRYFDFPVR
jgi:D-alanyl-D-alanine dipeptidase